MVQLSFFMNRVLNQQVSTRGKKTSLSDIESPSLSSLLFLLCFDMRKQQYEGNARPGCGGFWLWSAAKPLVHLLIVLILTLVPGE